MVECRTESEAAVALTEVAGQLSQATEETCPHRRAELLIGIAEAVQRISDDLEWLVAAQYEPVPPPRAEHSAEVVVRQARLELLLPNDELASVTVSPGLRGPEWNAQPWLPLLPMNGSIRLAIEAALRRMGHAVTEAMVPSPITEHREG
ncbi:MULTISPECIES: hypothetical protein [unclassified Crossiella]|uniref:hypothetical protein n=1 Tax=Crossiella sp. CA-258035 TaxID=2981138 RepID=UPI0024BCE515|nr:hypothetical protein [Crossiella sp. CA-258035]WHT21766.1 hypothetical protein N8J89_12105 [Crossiella sp. CA-258035]